MKKILSLLLLTTLISCNEAKEFQGNSKYTIEYVGIVEGCKVYHLTKIGTAGSGGYITTNCPCNSTK